MQSSSLAAVVPPYKLTSQIINSIRVLRDLTEDATPDEQVNHLVLQKAKGLVMMTQIKAGFIWSGSVAAGIVIVRLPDGSWSAPASIGAAGMGWGLQAGAHQVDHLLALHDDFAIGAFMGAGQVKFGGELSITAGPIGRNAQLEAHLGTSGVAGTLSYARSRGFFGGVGLDGSVIVRRDADNEEVYGKGVSVDEILGGQVTPPKAADELYALLERVTAGKTDGAAAEADAMPRAAGGSGGGDGTDGAESVDLSDPDPSPSLLGRAPWAEISLFGGGKA